ncbi:hypothetical protein [Streptomyces sp. LN245]|uniref:hypothetical protein n=1 Tax=Streptomyces sp. LN245 TaxID=3112975 RepID=UPI003721A0B7
MCGAGVVARVAAGLGQGRPGIRVTDARRLGGRLLRGRAVAVLLGEPGEVTPGRSGAQGCRLAVCGGRP